MGEAKGSRWRGLATTMQTRSCVPDIGMTRIDDPRVDDRLENEKTTRIDRVRWLIRRTVKRRNRTSSTLKLNDDRHWPRPRAFVTV